MKIMFKCLEADYLYLVIYRLNRRPKTVSDWQIFKCILSKYCVKRFHLRPYNKSTMAVPWYFWCQMVHIKKSLSYLYFSFVFQ